MKLIKTALVVAFAASAISACDGTALLGPVDSMNDSMTTSNPAATGNIVQTAVEAGSFNTLAAALTATGLDAVLMDETRQFTVFAPTDAAFDELGQDTVNALLADPDTLSDILLYHVLADQDVDSGTAISLAGNSVDAANGDPLQISLDGSKLFINQAEVTGADVAATNGTIHVINKVMLPPTQPAGNGDAGNGGAGNMGDGGASAGDNGDGGTDAGNTGGGDTNAGSNEPTGAKNLVETAIEAGAFNTLAAALEATDLVSVLADENARFTVFAPTDDAFAKLGQSTIDSLLADPDTLRDILLYHVVAGQVVDSSTAVSLAGSSVEMANGDSVAVSTSMGKLLLNTSVVTATDITASNGVIHVLDTVLMPPADKPEPEMLMSIYDTAIAAGNFRTLVTALQVTGLDGPLAGDHETYTVFAPTDDAFALLGEDTINGLIADPETLKNILLYHVISGSAVNAETAISLAGNDVAMANGENAGLTLRNGSLYINDAKVIVTDVMANNGIIHAIDAVLTPH